MDLLKERIIKEGKNLGGGILKVDSFINHQVDPILMDACGAEFARMFANLGATRILTAEISGIASPDDSPNGEIIITSVPEPTTLAVVGLGGLSLLLFRRRK